MDELIAALTIFRKYGNPRNPTHCEHDKLTICIDPTLVSEDDKKILLEMGFYPDEDDSDCFYSFRFGSA